ncbi:MAG: aldehyde dehydrogenase family protein, partial [Psychrobacter sp.]
MSESTLNLSNPDLLKQQCLVKDGWHTASSGETLEVSNPFNGALIGTVPSLTTDDVNDAVAASHKAQIAWAEKTAQERADLLLKWAELIDANKEDLAIIMTAEQGKPLSEARGEIDYANSFIRWFSEEGKRVYGDVIPANKSQLRHVILKQPVGVCAAITPWNFPSAMITRKAAPALAAGCTMIIKPATATPFSALALGVLAEQAGIPAGVIQVVTGKSSTIGDILT